MSLRAPHGLLAAGTLALQVFATSPADAFDEGNRQYGLGNYPEAIRHYESVVAQHGVSAPLLYNLGTAQLRAGRLGAASASLVAAQLFAESLLRRATAALHPAPATTASDAALVRAAQIASRSAKTLTGMVAPIASKILSMD